MKKHNDQEDVQTVSGNSTSKATLSSGDDTSGGARTSDAVESLKDQIDLEERYGIDPDTNNIEGAQLRHPNRNLDKTGSNKRTAKSTASRAGRKRNEANSTNAALPEEITNLSKDYWQSWPILSRRCVSLYIYPIIVPRPSQRVV